MRGTGRLPWPALALLALGFSACATGEGATGAVRLTGRARTLPVGTLTASDVGAAQRAFGLDVLSALCHTTHSANLTLSPASLADLLGLLDAGAGGVTRHRLAHLLHLPAWGRDLIAAQQARTRSLAALASDPHARVLVSNHVWAQAGARPQQTYLDDIRTAFDADLRTVDFAGAPAAATDSINAAVDHDTEGLIPTLFDRPLDAGTVDVLTNAVYLDARWQQAFDPHSDDATFTTAAGPVTVPMMSTTQVFDWTAADGWQAATLPYQGGTLSAVAMLPPEASSACTVPSASALDTLLGRAMASTTVRLPRMRLEQTHQLLPTLTRLGLPADGDYSAIHPGAFLSQVVQKVVVEVDESGTRAAAATGGAMATSARLDQHHLSFDRPFLFLVRDTATGSPLFLSWVGDPTRS